MTLKDMTTADTNTIAATLDSELALFTGTMHHYRNFLGLLYTDGIQYLAERAGAYWLIDAIASWQPKVRPLAKEFQLWELVVNEDRSADLTARWDTGEPVLAQQKIECTDFPLKSITLYVQNGVLLLPSEYWVWHTIGSNFQIAMTFIFIFEGIDMAPLHIFTIGKWWMREAAHQPVPPRIIKSLRRVIAYLELEKVDYENTPLDGREGHIYRDLRRLEAWLTDWAGDGNGFEYPAMLENLGTILLTPQTGSMLPHEKLAHILEAHQMHQWGAEHDIAWGEGNHGTYERIRDHNGIVYTRHFVRTANGVVVATVETKMSTRTVVDTEYTKWPENLDEHMQTYLYESDYMPLVSHPHKREED
jgi:hypothetical protein